MAQLNAASPPSPSKHSLFAATGVTRKDTSSSFGGYVNFDITNRFRYYMELSKASPHVSTSLDKLGLSLTKGMRFDSTGSRNTKDFETWAKKVNFKEQVKTLAKNLCRDGTYVALPVGTADTFQLLPFLMPNVTMLPEGVTVGASNVRTVMSPPVVNVVVNEKPTLGTKTMQYEPGKVVMGAINAWDGQQKDVLDRDTFGMYGYSLLEPIELSIRNLLSINRGYVSFVEKYGNGRYVFNFKLLEKLLELKLITIEEADAVMAEFQDSHQYLKQNEDIMGVGIEVTPIDANGSLDVLSFKKSLEADIQIGLYQTPLSMGDTKGSTYAAGYVSEADRMVVLEGLQTVVQNITQQAINLRLELMNKPADSVWIEFDELSKPQMTAADINEWAAMGRITDDEARVWAGFPVAGK